MHLSDLLTLQYCFIIILAHDCLIYYPLKEVGIEETDNVCVDSETLSSMENVLQPSEESIDDILNLESPLGSFEEYDVNMLYAYPNAAEKDSEKGQASACASVVDEAVPDSHVELHNTRISLPSLLSREGFTADSFSMCFGQDGVGRISFGDKGKTPVQLQPITVSGNFCVLDANGCPAQPHKDFYLIQQCKDLISVGTWSVRVTHAHRTSRPSAS